jgi:hypothetical protein
LVKVVEVHAVEAVRQNSRSGAAIGPGIVPRQQSCLVGGIDEVLNVFTRVFVRNAYPQARSRACVRVKLIQIGANPNRAVAVRVSNRVSSDNAVVRKIETGCAISRDIML